MNLLSINMCGIREKVKRRRVANLCSEHGVSFLAIQESRVTSVDLFELTSLWGSFTFDFAVSSSRRLSGGLISLWDQAASNKIKITCLENAIIVHGEWMFSKFRCFMVNVYAPQPDVQKRRLWGQLLDFMEVNPGDYVLCGDFNAVREMTDRWGSDFPH